MAHLRRPIKQERLEDDLASKHVVQLHLANCSKCPLAVEGRPDRWLWRRGCRTRWGHSPTVWLANQRHVLVLECVHQLVRHDDAQLRRLDVARDVQGVGIRIVVACDLFGEQIDHRRPQLERVGDQAEQPQRRLDPREIGRREVFVELVNDVVAHLRAGPAQHHGLVLELQAGGFGHHGHHAMHHVLQLRVTLHRLGALAAPQTRTDGNRSHGR